MCNCVSVYDVLWYASKYILFFLRFWGIFQTSHQSFFSKKKNNFNRIKLRVKIKNYNNLVVIIMFCVFSHEFDTKIKIIIITSILLYILTGINSASLHLGFSYLYFGLCVVIKNEASLSLLNYSLTDIPTDWQSQLFIFFFFYFADM